MTSDVIIIGGGLVGCAAAYYLSKGGAKVILLEAGELNRQASGRNAGSLHFQLEHRLFEGGFNDADIFGRLLPLNVVAIEDWKRLEHELNMPMEVHMRGGLMVGESAADLQTLERKFEIEKEWGLPTQLFTKKQAITTAPFLSDAIQGAGFCEHEGHANPRLATYAFASAAESYGADIRCGIYLTGLHHDGSNWILDTDDRKENRKQKLAAGAVLNCAGAWAERIGNLAGVDHPVIPVPLLMNVTDRTFPFIPHLIQHVQKKLSLKQVHDGNILIGGGWPSQLKTTDNTYPPDVQAEIIPENVQANLATACSVVPILRQRQLIRCWTGLASITADQLPLLGQSRQADNYFVASSGSAFTLGPTYARLMSELILENKPSNDISLFDPDRFLSPRQNQNVNHHAAQTHH